MQKTFALVMALLVLSASAALAAMPGDLDDSTKIEIRDAVLAMQCAANPSQCAGDVSADVNGDNLIDLHEALYALQVNAGMQVTGGVFTNALGMSFKRIPAGTFMMGSPEDEPGRYDNETQHQVTLTRDYYMMTTEVTQVQWLAVMGSNPSYFSACGADCPVEFVSWDDIQGFITALNQRGEGTYRLPTEAEWEYAARAGSTTAFANGPITYLDYTCNSLDPNLDAMGWYCGNSNNTTHPVGQKQPNAWGLYDMHGNVEEWCADWYGSYPAGAVTDPAGPDSGAYRVVRGGGWVNGAGNCRSASRDDLRPGFRHFLGFRLAFSPGQ